ncbi:MAG: HAD family hydrolase [Thermodesulfobacteriota bacterium]
MSFKTAIFDLDGTLFATLEDIADSVNRVLSARGFPSHALESYRFFVGDGSRMLVKRALPENERSDESVERFQNAFKKDYANAWDVKTKPYKGIPELLDCLVQKGVIMAVCSNKPHAFTALCVEKLLDRSCFDQVMGQSSRYPKKPAPDSALAIAHDMGVAPSEIVFIGDSGVDMQTAVAAGMLPVGASWGFRPDEELLENGCQFLARNPMDVLKIFNNSLNV